MNKLDDKITKEFQRWIIAPFTRDQSEGRLLSKSELNLAKQAFKAGYEQGYADGATTWMGAGADAFAEGVAKGRAEAARTKVEQHLETELPRWLAQAKAEGAREERGRIVHWLRSGDDGWLRDCDRLADIIESGDMNRQTPSGKETSDGG